MSNIIVQSSDVNMVEDVNNNNEESSNLFLQRMELDKKVRERLGLPAEPVEKTDDFENEKWSGCEKCKNCLTFVGFSNNCDNCHCALIYHVDSSLDDFDDEDYVSNFGAGENW